MRSPHEVSCLPRACGVRSVSDAHTQLKHSFLYGLLQLVYPSISSSCSVYGIDTLTRFPLEAILPTSFHREIIVHFIHGKHFFPTSLSSFVSQMQGWCSNTPLPSLFSSGFRVHFLYISQAFLVLGPSVECPHPGNKLHFSGLGTSYCHYISQTLYLI